MTKILLILENMPSPIGGIERHCFNIMRLFSEDKDVIIKVLSKEDIKYRFIKGINKILFNKKELYNKIKEFDPDVVHIHGFASFAVVQSIDVANKLKKKIVYTAHYHPFYTLDNPLLGKCFFYAFLALKLKKVHSIITINKEDTDFFKKYSSNVRMIPHWLNDNNIKDISESRRDNMVLFVGRAETNKGLDHLYSLPKDRYEIHCVSSGTFDRKDFFIHKNIQEKELYKLYSQASVLVVPSRYEAFSYAALEALTIGTPIVVSDRVRIADYLTEMQGKGVEVFPYNNFEAFNCAVEKACHENVNSDKVSMIFNKKEIKNKILCAYME